SFFAPRTWRIRRPEPDCTELDTVVAALRAAERPVIVAGGGVVYSGAEDTLLAFATRHNIPVTETQAGKGAIDWQAPVNLGSPGVTGGDAANAALAAADLVLGVGTRFQDFTTGSWTVFANPERRLVSINVTGHDAAKHGALPLLADAKVALEHIGAALGDRRWPDRDAAARAAWYSATDAVMAAPNAPGLPTDAQVIGAMQRQATPGTVVMCAAGTMPGALHTLWRAAPGGYHMEYGFSCMGYEIAGAMGIKLARPDADVVCFVGDGSYMMANSELATAVMRRIPFTVILTDNRGYGCINRLQQATGGAEFNNLYTSSRVETQPEIDFVAHAAAMGAVALRARDIADLEARIGEARGREIPTVIVIETDPYPGTGAGGHWWDVAVPEVSPREGMEKVRAAYLAQTRLQRVD
ncbi:MAG: thiamine pyrophosphate-dependent enzyme, partial [Pseudomonadota bacterium]